MSTAPLKLIASLLSAAAAFAAAWLWYKASTATVKRSDLPPGEVRVTFFSDTAEWDPIRTHELQAKWNKRGAAAASVAALLQAIAMLLPGDGQ